MCIRDSLYPYPWELTVFFYYDKNFFYFLNFVILKYYLYNALIICSVIIDILNRENYMVNVIKSWDVSCGDVCFLGASVFEKEDVAAFRKDEVEAIRSLCKKALESEIGSREAVSYTHLPISSMEIFLG